MRNQSRHQIAKSNHTLDKFLKPRSPSQSCSKSKLPNTIKVPPNSGLPPISPPSNAVLRYPTKPQLRQYQQEIVSSCICNNTLVCLPTGLGKTHVAAVVIANFARWFPEQLIIFLAPTRPLVRQQISALRNLRDQISKEKILEVNGQLPANKREQLYQSHQVIFATPQTVENDLQSKKIDGRRIILFIFDECHRATGNFSYTQIIKHMNSLDIGYRVIGLSATPGSELQKVQEVICNLNIKKIMYKDENDPQVKKYLHQKIIHEVVIPENGIIKEALSILERFARPSLGLLCKLELIEQWMARGLSSTSFHLIRLKFAEKISSASSNIKSLAYAALKILGFMFRCRKSLNDQGYETFKSLFFSQIEPPKPKQQPAESTKQSNQVKRESTNKQDQCEQYDEISLDNIYEYFPQQQTTNSKTQNSKAASLPVNFKKSMLESKDYKRLYQMFHRGVNNYMHPKLLKLSQILKSFFEQKQGKAIVFTQLRMSAKEIKEYLSGIQCIRSELFFGQSKTQGQNEQTGESFCLQLKQKDQLQVIQKYKCGQINTLISTSIGEEGLDIGQVDCIICYDGGHSPIRSIQRRGRTGRKRAGEVYMLLMEGKQSTQYKKGSKKEGKMKEMLKKEAHKFQFFPYNSTLFEENTTIPIQLYENNIVIDQSAKKTKVKQSPKHKNDKQEKKTRRRKNQKIEVSEQEEQSKLTVPEEDVEINITTIGNLLDRYRQDEATIEQKWQQSYEQKFFGEQDTNIATISTSQQHQSIPIDDNNTLQATLPVAEEQDDDQEDILREYFKNKKQQKEREEESAILELSNSMDTMDSEQILAIFQNLQKQRDLANIDQDSF